jgi:ATP-dependent DNA helicase RecQ
MMQLVQNKDECIQNFILNYFDEPKQAPCGSCSNCKPKQRYTRKLDENLLLQELKTSKAFEELLVQFQVDPELLTNTLRNLLERKKIYMTNDNKYQFHE